MWGPFPRETLERALDPGLPARYVRGNADRELATGSAPEGWVAEVDAWCAGKLDARHRDFLLGQEESVRIGDVLFCHGAPGDDERALSPVTPDEELAAAVADAGAAIVVCGHTHVQMDRTVAGTRVVNAGSVGMPYEGAPGAYWCLLDGDEVSLRRTEYDFAAAAAAVQASGCPYAADFAAEVLAPTAPEDALRELGLQ